MPEKLKPCPWCQSDRYLSVLQDTFEKKQRGMWGVLCSNPYCYRIVGYWDSAEEATRSWNHRPGEERLMGTLREARAAIIALQPFCRGYDFGRLVAKIAEEIGAA